MPRTVYLVVAVFQLVAANLFLWLSVYDARFGWWAMFAVTAAMVPLAMEKLA